MHELDAMTLFAVAISLALDAFSASIAGGIETKKPKKKRCLKDGNILRSIPSHHATNRLVRGN